MEEKARRPINPCFSRGRSGRAALELKAGGRHGWRVGNGLGGLDAQQLVDCFRLCSELSAADRLDLDLPVVRRELVPIRNRRLLDAQDLGYSRLRPVKLDDFACFHGLKYSGCYPQGNGYG